MEQLQKGAVLQIDGFFASIRSCMPSVSGSALVLRILSVHGFSCVRRPTLFWANDLLLGIVGQQHRGLLAAATIAAAASPPPPPRAAMRREKPLERGFSQAPAVCAKIAGDRSTTWSITTVTMKHLNCSAHESVTPATFSLLMKCMTAALPQQSSAASRPGVVREAWHLVARALHLLDVRTSQGSLHGHSSASSTAAG